MASGQWLQQKVTRMTTISQHPQNSNIIKKKKIEGLWWVHV